MNSAKELSAEIERLKNIISSDRESLRTALYGKDWGHGKDPKELFAAVERLRANCEARDAQIARAAAEETITWYESETDRLEGMIQDLQIENEAHYSKAAEEMREKACEAICVFCKQGIELIEHDGRWKHKAKLRKDGVD
jgi:uncharacterized membrane protein YccC